MSDIFCPICEKSTAIHDGDCEHYHCSSCKEQWIKPIPEGADVGELVEKANRYVKSVNAFEDGSSGDAYNELETAWYDFCAELDKWR